jgi:hypothetical protein
MTRERHTEGLLVHSKKYFTAFYSNTMKRDRFFHILRFLHFSNNKNQPDKRDEYCDRLWKMRTIFEKVNDAYAKYYIPTEHLAIDEVIVLFKVRVTFKQYIPKKHKRFGIKIYKLCDSLGYSYNMTVYLGKDRKLATPTMTATHVTVTGLTGRIENLGHKLYMDSFFSLHKYLTTCIPRL